MSHSTRTDKIPEMLLNKMIEAGKASDLSWTHHLLTAQEQNDFNYIMRLRPEPWFSVADALTDEELIALIRCLTIVEREYVYWLGGSVSPVVWLFQKFSERKPECSYEVADWVLANTENDYLPFGTLNGGAKSLDEFYDFKEFCKERRIAIRESEIRRHKLAQERKATKATWDIFGAVKRQDFLAVKALIFKGADINAKDYDGISIFEHAQLIGNEDILELLKSKGLG